MLVVISDLHLTDGSSGATISPGAFEIFIERLADLAQAASRRASGAYRPIDSVDVLLLGDVLDLIRSASWLGSEVRPWSDLAAPATVRLVQSITNATLEHNESSLSLLRSLMVGGLRIPAATASGQPAEDALEQIPVRLHYMTGNHDWFFHVGLPQYHPIRKAVVERMGLANRFDQPFAYDAIEDPEILDVLRRHRVCARHGDLYDPMNFMGDRDVSSLGDAVVIELLTSFAINVDRELGADLPAATVAGLRELDNLRPLLCAPIWIDGLLERTCPHPSIRTKIKRVWDRLVDSFLELPIVREHDTWSPVDVVDGLQRFLKFSKMVSIGTAGSVVEWLERFRGSGDDSYFRHALSEQDFRNRRARHVVYGHTHTTESVPLDASFAEGYVLDQVYFNTGTWRRVHRPTKFAPREHEFIAAETMTYLAFFAGDERAGRAYETWSGTLATGPIESATRRIDIPAPKAPAARIIPRIVPLAAPHFVAPSIRSLLPKTSGRKTL